MCNNWALLWWSHASIPVYMATMFTMKYVWNAVLGKVFLELTQYITHLIVMPQKHSGKTVGHLPRKLSELYSMFINQGGDIALWYSVFTVSHITISNGA